MTAASPATNSAAAEWQLQAQIAGERYRPNLPLLGISCPSASFCVAVGELDTIVSTTNPTGGASAWHQAKPAGEANTDCHEHWSPPCVGPQDRRIRGVSCPSAQLCVAVTGEGYVYSSTNPTGSGDDWRVADIDGDGRDTHLLSVSCPTASLCVAVSGERYTSGKVLTSTNPTGGASAWTVTQLDESLDLRGVSCGTPTFCVAVAQQGRVLVSANPTGGASAWTELGAPGGPGDLQGISCASAALCVAGNAGGNLLSSTAPTVASSWRETSSGASVQVTSVSCLPSRQCVAVNNNGDVITSTDPTVGSGSWSRTKLIPYVQPATELDEPLNGLFGVSCPLSSFCALVAADGQIFTNTDPFAEPAGPSKDPGRHKKKVKRPRVTIARLHLPSRRELREHRARAIVRFYANGRTQRFECKVDRRRFHRCHSPNRFRIGRGIHALRIRAVGMTGLRGPAAVKRFWIGKRCTGHQCHVGGGELPPKARLQIPSKKMAALPRGRQSRRSSGSTIE
ncbi:MAG: WD40/YVTN/BNR-like repeat-containing protein [Solirubrobacterales bacterium]